MKTIFQTLLFSILLLPGFTASAQGNATPAEVNALVVAALANENDSMKTFFLRDSMLGRFYPDWESDSTMLAGLSKEIGKENAEHMLQQRKDFRPQTWDASQLSGATILSNAYLKKTFASKKAVKNWEKYYSTHRSGYFEISAPVFSRDKKTAVLYMAYHCGVTCGHGAATLYRFEDGKWKVVRNLFAWINN